MRESAMRTLMTLAMLATFAFAASAQQSDKPSSQTKQDKSSSSMTNKSDRAKHNDSMQDASGSSSMLDPSDRKFVMEAAHGGMMEVALGRTAVDKATNADVKQFAQRMVDDHSKANAELQQLASQKGITLPASDMTMTDHSSSMSSSTTSSSTMSSSTTSGSKAQPTDSRSSTDTSRQRP